MAEIGEEVCESDFVRFGKDERVLVPLVIMAEGTVSFVWVSGALLKKVFRLDDH